MVDDMKDKSQNENRTRRARVINSCNVEFGSSIKMLFKHHLVKQHQLYHSEYMCVALLRNLDVCCTYYMVFSKSIADDSCTICKCSSFICTVV